METNTLLMDLGIRHGEPKMGLPKWWANERRSLDRGTFPHASVNEDGCLILTEIDIDRFLEELPGDGWNGSGTIQLNDEKGHYDGMLYINFHLGMRGGVAVQTYPRPRRYFRVGCYHHMQEHAATEDRWRGHSISICSRCGLTIRTDSSG